MGSHRETLSERYQRVAAKQRETLVVCADDFRVDEQGIYSHEGDMGLIAWRMAQRTFEELLPKADRILALAGAPAAGKTTWTRENRQPETLILDMTLSRRLVRREVCAMASAAGREIECVFLHPKVEVCLMRNASRGRQVPEAQVLRAHHRLTVCPPGMDEGWSEVTVIGDGLEADRAPVEVVLDRAPDRP